MFSKRAIGWPFTHLWSIPTATTTSTATAPTTTSPARPLLWRIVDIDTKLVSDLSKLHTILSLCARYVSKRKTSAGSGLTSLDALHLVAERLLLLLSLLELLDLDLLSVLLQISLLPRRLGFLDTGSTMRSVFCTTGTASKLLTPPRQAWS
jgi:hypothetical protein